MSRTFSLFATAAAAVAAIGALPAQAQSFGVSISTSALASHAGAAGCSVNYPAQVTCSTPADPGHVSATASVNTPANPALATRATSSAHEDGPANQGGTGTATVTTTVDLATASLHMSSDASGTLPGGGGHAASRAQLFDTLHFSVAGAGADTLTTIGVSFSIDGTMTTLNSTDAAEFYGGLNFGGKTAQFYLSNFGNSATNPNQTTGSFNTYPAGFDNGVWTSNSDDTVNTFTGTYTLTGASQDLTTLLEASMDCRNAGNGGSVSCDYGNTVKISLQLPSDVSYTSDSGVFLTGGTVTAAVPEPQTWAMLIGGLGVVGGLARRRR